MPFAASLRNRAPPGRRPRARTACRTTCCAWPTAVPTSCGAGSSPRSASCSRRGSLRWRRRSRCGGRMQAAEGAGRRLLRRCSRCRGALCGWLAAPVAAWLHSGQQPAFLPAQLRARMRLLDSWLRAGWQRLLVAVAARVHGGQQPALPAAVPEIMPQDPRLLLPAAAERLHGGQQPALQTAGGWRAGWRATAEAGRGGLCLGLGIPWFSAHFACLRGSIN